MAQPEPQKTPISVRHRLEDMAGAALIGLVMRLPYARRVRTMGWVFRRVLGPLGFNRRTRANLAYVCPDLSAAETRRLCAEVADNFGRVLIELHSGREFAERTAHFPIGGPGLAQLDDAHAAGRPVVLVSAHFGNYDAWRAGLIARGFSVGGLYKPMSNPATNARYVPTIEEIGQPLFPRGNAGMAGMIRFLRRGGMLGLLGDLYVSDGELLDFLGKPARTATSAAKMALKYDALLVPLYATRDADGLNFTIEVETPIPHSDATTMTQALNDSAAARIRENPGQWFWVHRRWKHNQPEEAQTAGPSQRAG